MDSEEAGISTQYNPLSGRLGRAYQEKEASLMPSRNNTLKESLLEKKERKLQEIERIDRVLAILDEMPGVEELLNLLPTVGY